MRLLATGNINKNDPNDARSVAVAALRSAGVREACGDDHAAVLKVWSKRYRDLGRARTQMACRLHQVLCELIPGGVAGEITAGQAERILASITPAEAVQAARWELAAEFTEDLRGIDARIRQTRKTLAAAVAAAGTSLTGLFGVGPVIAAAVTQIRHRHSQGHAYYQKKLAEGKTGKEALRALKRQISDAIYACLQADAQRAAARMKGPGGQPGNGSGSSAAGSHPGHRLFGQATPGPATHPTTPAADPAAGSLPVSLPSRTSGRPSPGPGKPRPPSGASRRP